MNKHYNPNKNKKIPRQGGGILITIGLQLYVLCALCIAFILMKLMLVVVSRGQLDVV